MAARGLPRRVSPSGSTERNVHRGVEIPGHPDGLVIELYVIAEYGTRISEVAPHPYECREPTPRVRADPWGVPVVRGET